MYIIDDSYLKEDKFIPNVGIGQGKENINPLIDGEVHSLLESIFGTKVYLELTSNLDADGKVTDDTEQKWLNLINGCEYEKGDKKYYFKGLIFKRGLYKNSLLAYYVFYKWLKQNVSKSVGVGEVVLVAKNAINVGLTHKVVDAWNKFWSLLAEGSYNKGYKYNHCGVPIYDYYGTRHNTNVSLFQFLLDNKDIYGELPLQLPLTDDHYGFRNSLGL